MAEMNMIVQLFIALVMIYTAVNAQTCKLPGFIGCNLAAGTNESCCPDKGYCNLALTCMSCLPAGSLLPCSTSTQGHDRCCSGLICNAARVCEVFVPGVGEPSQPACALLANDCRTGPCCPGLTCYLLGFCVQ